MANFKWLTVFGEICVIIKYASKIEWQIRKFSTKNYSVGDGNGNMGWLSSKAILCTAVAHVSVNTFQKSRKFNHRQSPISFIFY